MSSPRRDFHLSEIIRTYSSTLYSFVRRFGFNDEETKDILQDTFIKIWKYSSTFEENKSSLKTWIFTITRNTLYDALRKIRRDNDTIIYNDNDDTPFEDIEDTTQNIITILENTETRKLLLQAIETLTNDEKTIIFLHVEESMTFNELHIITGKPLNSIKSTYRRSLHKIKNYLEKMHQNLHP